MKAYCNYKKLFDAYEFSIFIISHFIIMACFVRALYALDDQ